MLLRHDARRAASRACCTAGRRRATRTAMIAITTSSSISVKPRRTRDADEGVRTKERCTDEPPGTDRRILAPPAHAPAWLGEFENGDAASRFAAHPAVGIRTRRINTAVRLRRVAPGTGGHSRAGPANDLWPARTNPCTRRSGAGRPTWRCHDPRRT